MMAQQAPRINGNPSFPRTHPPPSNNFNCSHPATAARILARRSAAVDRSDPPLDLFPSTSLSDSFGLREDREEGDRRDFDEEFERIYERDEEEAERRQWRSGKAQHQQQRHVSIHIHRTRMEYRRPVAAPSSWQPVHHGEEPDEDDDADGDGDGSTLVSVGLNPYVYPANAGDSHRDHSNANDNHNDSNVHAQGSNSSHPTSTSQRAHNRNSIFRSLPGNHSELKLPSPHLVMNRRAADPSPKIHSAPTPTSSVFTHSTAPQPNVISSPVRSQATTTLNSNRRGILRNPTAVSSFTATTVSQPSIYGPNRRSRSHSRTRRRTPGGSAGRNTRSVSRMRDPIDQKDNREYHESLFRGAQLIKEQLMRSMAGVERSMHRADREFFGAGAGDEGGAAGDGKIEGGPGSGGFERRLREKPVMMGLEEEDLISVDFDYSRGLPAPSHPPADRAGGDDAEATSPHRSRSPGDDASGPPHRSAPAPSRPAVEAASSAAASAANSRLESESRRLDDLVKIFARSGSVSGGAPPSTSCVPPAIGSEEEKKEEVEDAANKSSRSDKENEQCPDDEQMKGWSDQNNNADVNRTCKASNQNKIASPNSTCLDFNNDNASKTFLHQSSNDESVGFEYAQQYLNAPKPNANSNNPASDDSPSVHPSQSALQLRYEQQQRQKLQNHQNHTVDEALSHASAAGPLWRSLVSNHVRFPSSWDDILPPSSPPVPSPNSKWSKWYYVARHRVRGDRKLNSAEFGVRSRRSGGRILLNLLVREMHTQRACRQVAVGCFHPNAKGIRRGDPMPEAEEVREVWTAVRWVVPRDCEEPELTVHHYEEDVECCIDNFLMQKRRVLDYQSMGSPLGRRKAVNNENVRAVFGDEPPLQALDLHEDELAEIIRANEVKRLVALPGLMLLKLFLFSK